MELKRNKYYYKFCFIIGIITGMLIGSCTISLLVSYRLDNAFETIGTLEQIINEKNTQLKNLEETIHSTNYVIKEIDVYLKYDKIDEDHITSLEIEAAIKEKYTDLLGKEVSDIDLELLVGVVDNRIFKLENKEFQINVEQLVLSESLKIWVKVAPWGG